MTPTPQNISNFWAKVRKTDSCWLWVGAGGKYGCFRLCGKVTAAHKASWILHGNAPTPAGLELLHGCDNPRCVNPAHLSVGTHAKNMFDAVVRGRMRALSTITAEAIKEIRSSAKPRLREFAEKFNCSPFTIRSIRHGYRRRAYQEAA